MSEEKTISQAGYYLSQIVRDLNQAKRAVEKFKKVTPDHPSVRVIEQKIQDCFTTASSLYCEETIR
jgi:hypothetical protein